VIYLAAKRSEEERKLERLRRERERERKKGSLGNGTLN